MLFLFVKNILHDKKLILLELRSILVDLGDMHVVHS